MTEKPILFSTEMVRAILEGRKTMTRRVVKPQPEFESGYDYPHENELGIYWKKEDSYDSIEELIADMTKHARYQPGDILWVRETWGIGTRPDPFNGWRDGIEYRADEVYIDDIESLPLYPIPDGVEYDKYEGSGWKPSIHMPHWAARLFLAVKSVRVERLQDITEEDALKEGCLPAFLDGAVVISAKGKFHALWDSINKKRGYGWEVNPYCWVISFERCQ